jgi:hypothetical protein
MIARDHNEFYVRLAESPPGTYHLILGRTLVQLSEDELARVGRIIIDMAQRRSALRAGLGLHDSAADRTDDLTPPRPGHVPSRSDSRACPV